MSGQLQRDESRVPLTNADWSGNFAKKSITFTALGDGAVGAVTLFSVTGNVLVRIYAVCTTTLTITAGATIEVGVTGTTAGLIAQTAGDAIDVNEIWHDATPDSGVELSSVLGEKIIANGLDIIQTVATNTITAGVIDYYCFWQPLSEGAKVE